MIRKQKTHTQITNLYDRYLKDQSKYNRNEFSMISPSDTHNINHGNYEKSANNPQTDSLKESMLVTLSRRKETGELTARQDRKGSDIIERYDIIAPFQVDSKINKTLAKNNHSPDIRTPIDKKDKTVKIFMKTQGFDIGQESVKNGGKLITDNNQDNHADSLKMLEFLAKNNKELYQSLQIMKKQKEELQQKCIQLQTQKNMLNSMNTKYLQEIKNLQTILKEISIKLRLQEQASWKQRNVIIENYQKEIHLFKKMINIGSKCKTIEKINKKHQESKQIKFKTSYQHDEDQVKLYEDSQQVYQVNQKQPRHQIQSILTIQPQNDQIPNRLHLQKLDLNFQKLQQNSLLQSAAKAVHKLSQEKKSRLKSLKKYENLSDGSSSQILTDRGHSKQSQSIHSFALSHSRLPPAPPDWKHIEDKTTKKYTREKTSASSKKEFKNK